MEIHTDPAVSRLKFERELENYRRLEDDYQRRGWWLLKATFPEVFIVFASAKTNPPAVVFGVTLDFTDYDFRPPSVRLVHPFTRVPYKASELPTGLYRTVLQTVAEGVTVPGVLNLMQWHRPDDIPFLCLRGVREYHEHPAHTGDLWELHRGNGEGTLYYLLDNIFKYGVEPISNLQLNLNIQISGFGVSQPPQ